MPGLTHRIILYLHVRHPLSVASRGHLYVKASFDDDELFTEATADIQSEIEESLTAATAALPSHAALVEHDIETVVTALESVKEVVDLDTAEAAVADVKKALLLGQLRMPSDRSMPQRQNQELEETVATLEAIASASEELREALAEYSVDLLSVAVEASSDKASFETDTEDLIG